MDRQVGLGDDDDSADAKRVELMEDDIDDRGLGPLRGLDQRPLHTLDVVDGVRVAIEQLEKQMSTQGVQSIPPPFAPDHLRHVLLDASLGVAPCDENFFVAAQKLIHCMVAILRLQEKNTPRSVIWRGSARFGRSSDAAARSDRAKATRAAPSSFLLHWCDAHLTVTFASDPARGPRHRVGGTGRAGATRGRRDAT